MQLFVSLSELGFLLYAVLKAFLPLPSLEVLLVPLCVREPQSYLRFALEGAAGTCVGGGVGYFLASRFRKSILTHFLSEEQMENWQRLMQKYGVLAVFIGGITPIPDFILPYLAGLTGMNFFAFSLTDGISRFLRSWLVGYSIYQASGLIDFQAYGNLLCAVVLLWGMIRWIKGRYYASDDR